MSGAEEKLQTVLEGYSNFLRERKLALPKHQPHLVRWVRQFLLFAREHSDYTFEQTPDLFLTALGQGAGSNSWQIQQTSDATCAPADIGYPTDLKLINSAREKSEQSIDTLHHPAAPRAGIRASEGGQVNIRVVQGLMGHADVKTTEIYTHVMEKSIAAVKSPLETLARQQVAD